MNDNIEYSIETNETNYMFFSINVGNLLLKYRKIFSQKFYLCKKTRDLFSSIIHLCLVSFEVFSILLLLILQIKRALKLGIWQQRNDYANDLNYQT